MREVESQRGDPRPAEAEVPTGWEQTVQTSVIIRTSRDATQAFVRTIAAFY